MKTYLAALALAAALAQPAAAVTFPSLTTIYVASGAYDNAAQGLATSVICSNVSGQSAQIGFSFSTATATSLALAWGP